jgi:hypothetical protein
MLKPILLAMLGRQGLVGSKIESGVRASEWL